ncbi:MAG: BT_3928 family protein, partial [Bacteroidota bacterium]
IRITFTTWSLLGMIVFFTFLTFYSAYFNKVTDCGCFGDAIKLTPWQSFYKDIVLLVLILIIFFGRKYIHPIFSGKVSTVLFLTLWASCAFFAYHVLSHLPVFDFRAYKTGVNIKEGMEIPEDAPQAVYEYAWTFNVDGVEKTITTSGDYPQVNGTFIDVETTEIQKGYEPPIHDFTIERNGTDHTEVMLAEDHLLMVISYDTDLASDKGMRQIKTLTNRALQEGYTVIGMSSATETQASELRKKYGFNFDFYFTDQTTLKTMIRSNPGVIVLKKGTIVQKAHYNDIKKLNLDRKNTTP